MRSRSPKRSAQMRLVKPLYGIYLEAHPFCMRCGRLATVVHHRRGRQGLRLLDQKWWAASCDECNLWAETCPTSEPFDTGWKVHKDVEEDPWQR